jgi:hypothetical protein
MQPLVAKFNKLAFELHDMTEYECSDDWPTFPDSEIFSCSPKLKF